jgi:signal peptidase II
MKKGWKRLLLVTGVIIASIALDQITKEIAKSTLMGEPTRHFLGDTFRLLFTENEGAFLSLGAGLSGDLRYWILTLLPIVILGVLLLYTFFSESLNRWQIIAYSFILGGGISNIYDRMLYGKVIDFMNLGIGELRTGIFNFADVSIMAGLFMLIPYLFKKPKKHSEN